MKYIVYLTTNLKSTINNINRIYIGVHKTENPDIFDGYIGDGVYVQQVASYMYPKTPFQYAVKKYGTDAFHRSILFIYDNKYDAYSKEAELVNKDFINAPHTYNIIEGGLFKNIEYPIYQFDLEGKLRKKWDCRISASEFYGVPPTRFDIPLKNKCPYLNSFWSETKKINVDEFIKKYHINITYLYTLNGKLIKEFNSLQDCAQFLKMDTKTVSKAIVNNAIIANTYYVSNKLTDIYIPKPRRVYLHETFYVYNKDGEFISKCTGKELMKVINLHSWLKISNIFSKNHNWYKDFYISLEEVNKVPEKRFGNGISIDVYDKYGNFIEHIDSIKKTKEKYNIPANKLKDIQLGDKYFDNYIFKYSK